MSGATTAQPLLVVDDVDVTFQGRGKTSLKAVDAISLQVNAGETFGIIGESGSGKTTLGRAIVCLTLPSRGAIRYESEDLFSLSPAALRARRRKFQIIFQDPNAALDPRMTILQSVREPLDLHGEGSRQQRDAKALRMLDRVSVSARLADRYPHELSGGQKQRANIARALVLEPRLIVCDEVVAALDMSIQADVLNLFLALQREMNLTYVFISHDLRVVSHVSDRVGVMYFGKLVETGPTHLLMDRPLHPYTQALMSAEPEARLPGHSTRRRIILTGEIPSLANPPTGCRFHTRCPAAADECIRSMPPLRDFGGGHLVACHFAGPLSAESVREEHTT
ncbi:ABC transporter ATP-binding protein [Hydrogenophaga sp.]|uniref:ABC transporter ATP-binding protein n=1 Tax=Hydrogenophaga sp. TaxID=1904254 RepID=UPI002720F8EF|nr:oligopeptide/dipeptide ABC transporter ATP-binding protein [Hydrogenophaga sp.]MDO9436266.1 ATP-binding cassette domain-containing protein [Hydrogenophaga sp.]